MASTPHQALEQLAPAQPLPPARPDVQDASTGPKEPMRPMIRAECLHGPRPCPWVTCRYHLWTQTARRYGAGGSSSWHLLTEDRVGEILGQMPQTCVLDVVRPGLELTLEEVGEILQVVRERVRQIQQDGERSLRKTGCWSEDLDPLTILRSMP